MGGKVRDVVLQKIWPLVQKHIIGRDLTRQVLLPEEQGIGVPPSAYKLEREKK